MKNEEEYKREFKRRNINLKSEQLLLKLNIANKWNSIHSFQYNQFKVQFNIHLFSIFIFLL